MRDWYDIYKERMNERYARKVREKYKPFIDEIICTGPTDLIELGCGAGTITKIIRECRDVPTRHTLIDSCPRMLGLAVENNPDELCKFICGDVTKKLYYSPRFEFNRVIHSHGVLEHFENNEICRIIELADKMAGYQIHYVPGAKYETPSRGDERLLTTEQWHEIMTSAAYNLGRGFKFDISTFNDGYDIMLKIRREFL